MDEQAGATPGRSPGVDVFGRPIITADELAAMTPEERLRVHEERLVKDLSTLPPDMLARLLISEEELAARSARLEAELADQAQADGRRAS